MRPFVFRWLGLSLLVGIVLATMSSAGRTSGALVGAALLLGLVNALVRPFTLRLTRVWLVISTLAMVIAVNVLFCVVLGGSIPPYQFPNVATALGGAALISVVSWPLNFFFRGSDGHVHPVTHHGPLDVPAPVQPPSE